MPSHVALVVDDEPAVPRRRLPGMLSTHYREPHRFQAGELRPIDEIDGRTARLLEPLSA